MTKLRALAVLAALASVSLLAPAAAQAAPPSNSTSTVITNGWRWND
jgi:hypothetical protein